MSKKSKKSLTPAQSKVEPTKEKQPEKAVSLPQAKPAAPEPVKPEKPLTLEAVHKELDDLRKLVLDYAQQVTSMQDSLARKRKAVPNGKIQILDKVTDEVYPSKNSVYQTLLKAGELKELVDKGVFGAEPEKNTFGWYALVRAWPDRFEEKKAAASK